MDIDEVIREQYRECRQASPPKATVQSIFDQVDDDGQHEGKPVRPADLSTPDPFNGFNDELMTDHSILQFHPKRDLGFRAHFSLIDLTCNEYGRYSDHVSALAPMKPAQHPIGFAHNTSPPI